MASQPEPSTRPRAAVRRDPLPPLAREPQLRLTPGVPCPRCQGCVIVRDVVTPEGALSEHFCLGCARTSNPVFEAPEPVPRLVLSPSCEAQLDRVISSVIRQEDGRSSRSSSEGVDDTADSALSRSALDAADIRAMFAVECQPDVPPWQP
jgi:hypothetical protein